MYDHTTQECGDMKIAIIDDAQMNLTLLKHMIRKIPSCEAFCFLDPAVGLDWCLHNSPDLIIVDYMMPGMSGIELAQRYRNSNAVTPILMITANHETELRHQALQNGVTDFLNKPIDNVEFTARAKNMLALHRSHQYLEREVRAATAQLVDQERETIFCLSRAAEYRDPETGGHIVRMAHFSRHIAANMGLGVSEQELLLQTAPMHDIGKVGIPDSILLKPGKLTPEEFAIMKQHSTIGYSVLNNSKSPLLQVAAEIAHAHHEKFDGSGYPQGLSGTDIPLFGRIVAVADVFDALTSERPYKQAWSVEEAVAMLRDGSGKHFDPDCVNAFLTDFENILTIRTQFTDEDYETRDPRMG